MTLDKIYRILIAALVFVLIPLNSNAQTSFFDQFTPAGIWEADDHDSRYEVSLCGDGTQICAKLIWINPAKLNERNVQYMDKYVIYLGNRVRPAEWRGEIDIYGTKVGGSVRVLGQDKLQVTGCAFLILCEGFKLDRIG